MIQLSRTAPPLCTGRRRFTGGTKVLRNLRAARASRSVGLLAPLAAMFAGLPPSSSELSKRKSVFRYLLLQIGGANIENPPPSSSLAEEERLISLLLRAAARDCRRSQLGGARFARDINNQFAQRAAAFASPLLDVTHRSRPTCIWQLLRLRVTGFARRPALQPRWIWIRREAASAEGLGIRISRTPSL